MPEEIKDMPALIAAVEKTVPKDVYFAVQGEYHRHPGDANFDWTIYRSDMGGAGWKTTTPQGVWEDYKASLDKRDREKIIPSTKSQAEQVKSPEETTHG